MVRCWNNMTTLVPKTAAVKAGVIIVLVMTLVGIFAPLLAPHDPTDLNVRERMTPPFSTTKFPLGTDMLGRDMMSRLIYGHRTVVVFGVLPLLLGTVISLVLVWLGAMSSVFKRTGQLPPSGFLNYSLLRVAGIIFLTSPFPMAVVVAILGTGIMNAALVVTPFAAILPLSLIYWSVRSKLALPASSTGEGARHHPVRIAGRECLVLLPLTYSLAFLMGIFLVTPLSFLGLGVPPGAPSWGIMIAEGRDALLNVWWLSLLPLGMVTIAVGAFLAIALPIRRVQKQSDLFVQPDSMVMNYAGFWIRIESITVDVLAQIFIGIIFFIPFSFGFHENLFVVLFFAFEVLYTLFFLGGRWDSLGHRLVGIRVVRSNGERVGFGRSIARGFLIFVLPVSVWTIPFTRRRQALHDLLPDTVVVKRESLLREEQSAVPIAAAKS